MKKWLLTVLAASLLIPHGAAYAAKHEVKFFYNEERQSLQQAPYVHEGRVYVPLREIGNKLDLRTVWNSEKKTVYMWGPGSSVAWTLDHKTMYVSGQEITTDSSPIVIQQSIYVPVRFIADAFGADIAWDHNNHAIRLNYDSSPYESTELSKAKFWLDRSSLQLYVSEGDEPIAVIDDIHLKSTELLSMEAAVIDESSYLITLQSVTGEPHLHTYQYRYLIKDGELIHHSLAEYYGFKSTVNRSVFEGKAVMLNEATLEIVNTSGVVEQSYSLEELTGMEGSFIVEQVFDDYLLVRPYRLDALVLIDLESKQATKLYEELLSEEEQTYMEERYMDGEGIMFDYPGDQIRFVKREGDTFHFTYRGLLDQKEYNLTYDAKPTL